MIRQDRRESSLCAPRSLARLLAVGSCVGVALIASSCSQDQDSSYVIDGRVVAVNPQSVTVSLMDVIEARGEAHKRYVGDDGQDNVGKQTRIHDNYWTSGCDREDVGRVLGYENELRVIKQLKVGDIVRVNGRVGWSRTDCGFFTRDDEDPSYENRPIFHSMRLIPKHRVGSPEPTSKY